MILEFGLGFAMFLWFCVRKYGFCCYNGDFLRITGFGVFFDWWNCGFVILRLLFVSGCSYLEFQFGWCRSLVDCGFGLCWCLLFMWLGFARIC